MLKEVILEKELVVINENEAIKIVEPLMRSMISKYTGYFNYEDYYQLACMAVWKAFRDYDITRGASFPTFARWKLKEALSNEKTKESRIKRNLSDDISVIYLDSFIGQDGEDSQHEILGTSSFEEDLIDTLHIEYIVNQLTEYEARLMPVLLNKISGADFARMEGTSRSNICNQTSRLKKKLAKILNYNI